MLGEPSPKSTPDLRSPKRQAHIKLKSPFLGEGLPDPCPSCQVPLCILSLLSDGLMAAGLPTGHGWGLVLSLTTVPWGPAGRSSTGTLSRASPIC